MRVGDRGRVRFVAGYFRGGWDSQAAVDRFDPGRSGEAGVGGLDGGGVVGGDGVGGGEGDEFVGWVEVGGGDDVVAGVGGFVGVGLVEFDPEVAVGLAALAMGDGLV